MMAKMHEDMITVDDRSGAGGGILIVDCSHVGVGWREHLRVPEKCARRSVEAEGAKLTFTPDGIAEIARIAAHVNDRMENIGARRLHTVMTTLLEEVLYELPDRESKEITVDRAMVSDRLKEIVEDEDLRRYIL